MAPYRLHRPSDTPITIYALRDPFTHMIRYVGQTLDPERRLAAHRDAHEKGRHPQRASTQWLATLYTRAAAPELEILAVVPLRDADETERQFVLSLRAQGQPLTNVRMSCERELSVAVGTLIPLGIKTQLDDLARARHESISTTLRYVLREGLARIHKETEQ